MFILHFNVIMFFMRHFSEAIPSENTQMCYYFASQAANKMSLVTRGGFL